MPRPVVLALASALVLPAMPVDADPVGLGWPQPSGVGTDVVISYSYSNLFDGGFDTTLTESQIRGLTTNALEIWAAYAPIHFHEVPDAGPPPGEHEYPVVSPDIRIGYQLTLPDNHAAHAHLPFERAGYAASGLAGDIHLSNDTSAFGTSTWGYGAHDPLALDFFSLMLHELGHALGIPHLGATSSVMGMTLLRFDSVAAAGLRPSDIQAIRELYGHGVGSVHALGSAPLATPEPGTWMLLGSGMGLIAWRRLNRRSRDTAGSDPERAYQPR